MIPNSQTVAIYQRKGSAILAKERIFASFQNGTYCTLSFLRRVLPVTLSFAVKDLRALVSTKGESWAVTLSLI